MKTYRTKFEEAEARRKLRRSRTPQQQLSLLDKKLGKGIGAKKERKKLEKKMKGG